MRPIRYLFINDQGDPPFGTADEPTAGDLDFAAVGMRTIVRLADAHYYAEGEWRPIQPGVVDSADMESGPGLPFHGPATDSGVIPICS